MAIALIVLAVAIIASVCAFIGYKVYSSKNVGINQKKEEYNNIVKEIEKIKKEKEIKKEELENIKKEYNKESEKLAITKNTDDCLKKEYQGRKELLASDYNNKKTALLQALDAMQKECNEKTEQAKTDYEALVNEIVAQKEVLQQSIKEQQEIYRIAAEQNRKDQENEEKHYLHIPDIDKQEIMELNSVCNKLRNPLPLYKAIYDIYYKTPLSTLTNDLAVKGISGIYKLTDKSNGKVYIGQSVDIGERWKQHIKRGCGAEIGTISGTKLYNAMMENGVWNFKFELLQECEKASLNKQEKYWIQYFNTVEYGYNMKAGANT